MENAPNTIRMEGVHKFYALDGAKVHALRGIDLRIEPREFIAIMGPSGSGKSTLMNIVGCLDIPDDGRFSIGERIVSRLDADALAHLRNREIGFVFQGFNLLQRTSALDNVETPLIYAGIPRRQRHDRARDLLARVGLADRLNHYPNQLSGGEQQRVAIARALVNHPTFLLADEPTGNLDSATSSEIMSLLESLNGEEGLTILLITHEMEIADRASRHLTLRDGRLVE